MNMLAFDIDGVFISDISPWDDKILQFRNQNFRPIFEPSEKYIIISGRPKKDFYDTNKWFKTFNNPPVKIYLYPNNDEKKFLNKFEIAKSKASKINSLKFNIDIYYESDLQQCKIIQKKVKAKTKIIHWSGFLRSIII